jgi:restriction endonuclease Mrr
MAIPSTTSLKQPILREFVARGGTVTSRQVIEGVLSKQTQYGLSVSASELEVRVPSGTKQVEHRFRATLSNLKKMGLITGPVQGKYAITPEGQQWDGTGAKGARAPTRRAQPASRSAMPDDENSLAKLVARHIEGLKTDVVQRISRISPAQFEHLVAEFLKKLDYVDVRRTGGPGDGNVDVTATYAAPFLQVPVRVQVKHKQGDGSVGPTDVAAFRDRAGGVDHVLLMVTNGRFTDGAKETGSEHDRQRVFMIDGEQLVDELIAKKICLTEGPLGVTQIDDEFFAQFEASR